MTYTLRPRADKDGWTLLKDGIAIAGGSFKTCLDTLYNEPIETFETKLNEANNKIKQAQEPK